MTYQLTDKEINSISYSISRTYEENINELKTITDDELKEDLETMNIYLLSSYERLMNESLV